MVTLSDGTIVNDRIYNYLVEFNEQDEYKYIYKHFSKLLVLNLTIKQFRKLFEYVSMSDLTRIKATEKVHNKEV